MSEFLANGVARFQYGFNIMVRQTTPYFFFFLKLVSCNTIGKKLAHHKDSMDPNMRQGAVYQIPCHDCDFSYIGQTKRSFSIRKKEHLADIRIR